MSAPALPSFFEEIGFIPHRPGQPEAINADSFDEDVLQSPVPVLVEFWAARCGPCRRLAPDLAQVASEFRGRVRVFTVDVDDELDAATRCDVWAIPAVLRFDQGRETARLVGNEITLAMLVHLAHQSESAKGETNAENHVG